MQKRTYFKQYRPEYADIEQRHNWSPSLSERLSLHICDRCRKIDIKILGEYRLQGIAVTTAVGVVTTCSWYIRSAYKVSPYTREYLTRLVPWAS